jgi:hypothetical protein
VQEGRLGTDGWGPQDRDRGEGARLDECRCERNGPHKTKWATREGLEMGQAGVLAHDVGSSSFLFFYSCFVFSTQIHNLNSNLFMGFTQGSSAQIKVLA